MARNESDANTRSYFKPINRVYTENPGFCYKSKLESGLSNDISRIPIGIIF
jgi:hypothetical protein